MRRALGIALTALLVTAPAAAAAARTRIAVEMPRIATTGDVVRVRGRVSRPARLVLQRRTGAGWRRAGARVAARRRFRLRWRAPARPGVAVLRVAAVGGGASRAVRVAVAAVDVLAPPAVLDAPPPGESGTVRYAGSSGVRVGDFVAIDASPVAPLGLLARVVAKRSEGEIETVPATLAEAVPEGSIRPVAAARAARASRHGFGVPLGCGPAGEAQVGGSLAVGLDPVFELSWSGGRVRTATAAATIRGSADLAVTAGAGGKCHLEPIPVGRWNAPPLRFFAGPIPVVIVPRTTLYVSAETRTTGAVATRIRGQLRGTAGLRYDGTAHPIGAFHQSFSHTPPSARVNAALAARVIPSVEFLLYGQAGPRFDLSTGLQLAASAGDDTAWELSVPVGFSAGLHVPGLDVGPMTVLSRTIPLAHGRYGGAATQPPAAPARERARITWDSGADVDLHVWDAEGRHASYRESGIPGVLLSKDDTNGFGPETFEEDAPAGRRFTYGLCYFDARGAGATNVSVRITDPDGAARASAATLGAEGDSALLGSSPAGAAFAPPSGWCAPRH